MTLGDILIKNKAISEKVFSEVKKAIDKDGGDLEAVLAEKGVTDKQMAEAKSEFYGIPVKSLAGLHPSFDILKNIPEESARHYNFVPIVYKNGVLEIGMVKPDDPDAREALQFLSTKINLPFKIFVITKSDFENILKDYKSLGGEAEKVLNELESALTEQGPVAEEPVRKEIKLVEDAPATKMIAVILRHAVEGNASDVHIEPMRDKVKIRFRVDGILHTSLILPISVHDALVARIKILTQVMKLDEKRKPQDGRFEARILDKRADFRVSTFPTFYGEKVVIRILDPEQGLKSLEDIGMVGRNLDIVKWAIERPYGMVLLTGPTGSGKTTSLYAMIQRLEREKFNVVSLEDPIEYNIEGMSQSQVRPEIQYTFANGLRSILRQDPDIIMVGEIRDRITARLAIQAALTGHLVFSTLHTNNSVGVIPRLVDMGIEPYLISSTLLVAIAQRLVRTLCPESRKELPVIGSVKEKIESELSGVSEERRKEIQIPDKIYQGLPSAMCPRGTRGRTAVFEILHMTPELENIIITKPSEAAIAEEARRQGMLKMREDGILKVLKGEVGLAQLDEVV